MSRPRELILMRHAKSSWDSGAETDFDRPLADRGKRAAPRMGRWLRKRDMVPDLIVSSPAKRAAQTARLVAAELGVEQDEIVWDERIYGAGPKEIVAAATGHGGQRVLVIGHNPGLEDLVQGWGGRSVLRAGGKFFPTAAVAHVRLEDPGPKVLELMRPRDLDD